MKNKKIIFLKNQNAQDITDIMENMNQQKQH